MLTSRITASTLKAIAPIAPKLKAAAQADIIQKFGDLLPSLLPVADISSALRVSHFLAQVAHESDGFCTLEEYASGAAYEGRADLGNTQTGDGKRFKGRGPIQLTGRANYRAFTIWMRARAPKAPDFETSPELVATWPWAGWAVIFFWQTKKLNAVADRDDLVAVTKIINGGRNGLDDRARFLARAKPVIQTLVADALSAEQDFPVLRRGMRGEPVDRLQSALRSAGFYFLTIDGDFGPGTEGALMGFQRANGLVVDGIFGSKSFAALQPYFGEQA
ncbi:putative chitinase [Rhizobium subbaraonis]|uniref:Putative chitinase n=1 Tax=Rhizobium subbaraonis TaxID=908946 RepID=A0A285UXT9_9HYPH|nr:peptidoglycan-binding protein [Rhizobium subbaraonis]SOC46630.1 putative chitinase [Rhizobium subbaraonis]